MEDFSNGNLFEWIIRFLMLYMFISMKMIESISQEISVINFELGISVKSRKRMIANEKILRHNVKMNNLLLLNINLIFYSTWWFLLVSIQWCVIVFWILNWEMLELKAIKWRAHILFSLNLQFWSKLNSQDYPLNFRSESIYFCS